MNGLFRTGKLERLLFVMNRMKMYVQNMRSFYLSYENCQTLSGKLIWSHYCELLSVTDKDKRSFYEKEAINSN